MITNDELKERKKAIGSAIIKVLSEKNKRYGNAALEPINVFYKGDASNSILIRLDDKLQRIIKHCTETSNSMSLPEFRKNDMFDLLGYCILLSISKKFSFAVAEKDLHASSNDEPNKEFVDNVKSVVNTIFKRVTNNKFISNTINLSHPNVKFLIEFEEVINRIKVNENNDNSFEELILTLMELIWNYFIIYNITDFDDLID